MILARLQQFVAVLVVIGLALAARAVQPTSDLATQPPANGPRRGDSTWHVFINATVHPRPGETIERATLVIREGRIVSVQRAGSAGGPGDSGGPEGARVWDATGWHFYPGFIDPFLEVEAPRPAADAPGAHWNAKVTPQRSALDGPGVAGGDAEALRRLGFVAAAISPSSGIFRGASAVVSLARAPDEQSAARPPVYAERVYQTVAFEPAMGGRDASDVNRWPGYPNSQMGAIALIRQTFLDADWQLNARAGRRGSDGPGGAEVYPPINAIDALNAVRWGPAGPPVQRTDGNAGLSVGSPGRPWILFNADDELEALRAAKIAAEFQRRAVILGSGSEYQRLAAIKQTGLAFIEPLNFPKPPDVSTIAKQEQTDLREMMAWEQAPTNLRRLDGAGIKVAITTSKADRGAFWGNLRAAIRHGLAEDKALAMLTTAPAELLGVSDRLGSIEAGKVASFVVTDGPVFARQTKVFDVWIDGQRHEINPRPGATLEGTWEVTLDPAPAGGADITFVIDKDNNITIRKASRQGEGEDKKPKDATAKARNVRLEGDRLTFTFEHEPFGEPGVFVNSAIVTGDQMVADAVRADGRRFRWTARREPVSAAVGQWRVTEADGAIKNPDEKDRLEISIKTGAVKLTFTDADGKVTLIDARDVRFEGTPQAPIVKFTHTLEPIGGVGFSSDTITIEGDTFTGESVLPDGGKHAYKARRVADEPAGDDEDKADAAAIAAIPEKLAVPFGPYGVETVPEPQTLVLTNATIWTSGPAGVIEKGFLVVSGGKVVAVGSGSDFGAALPRGSAPVTLDLAGKHVTAGLIDCHSHTGISRGVNESGQAVTAEVRIQDVTDPDSINWYRELAGGLTVVNSLHGSANPIGGQSCLNKIRWGSEHPDDMHFAGRQTYSDRDPFGPDAAKPLVKPGIKFALGENVKQSNWGDRFTNRYPQTRMGVETLIRDRFEAAKAYAAARKQPGAGVAPRRDLELEALAEILAGDRLIHCHSYRQDEILMLARIARDYGFKIGTFQHILEGYKVADVVRDSAIGASGFTDWWAYKVEVQDAIPEGLPIMHDVGAIVSFNSDSDELARRMNGEAAKGIKYGGFSAEEALKFVTINPAKQLMIDDRVGSLEPGKDADFAVWSGSPLSSLSRCEATYIDGRCYFSRDEDAAARTRIAEERQRLIQKLLKGKTRTGEAKDGGAEGAGGREGGRRRRPPQDAELDLQNRAGNPVAMEPGDCGVETVQP